MEIETLFPGMLSGREGGRGGGSIWWKLNIIPRDAFKGAAFGGIEHYSVAYFHCFSVQSKCSAGLLLKVGLVHAVLTL